MVVVRCLFKGWLDEMTCCPMNTGVCKEMGRRQQRNGVGSEYRPGGGLFFGVKKVGGRGVGEITPTPHHRA